MKKYPAYVFDENGAPVYVADEAARTALVGTYYESPADVPGHKEAEAAPVSPPNEGERATMDTLPEGHVEKDRLLAEAKVVGLTVDKRWSMETLRRKIFEAGSA